MRIQEARGAAERLVEAMRPFCERIEIAGSIRRGRMEVKDVEIVCVPTWEEVPGDDLFGTPRQVNQLFGWAQKTNLARWIKPGVGEIIDWQPKEDGKYWRGLAYEPDGLKVDIFLAKPDNFGAIYLIRTGHATFSEAVVTHAKRIGKRCVEGYFTIDGEPVPTPEETDVFQLLNLPWVEPYARTGPDALARNCQRVPTQEAPNAAP
jgi:DNA polymerase/3'-5' exonuclease PolX